MFLFWSINFYTNQPHWVQAIEFWRMEQMLSDKLRWFSFFNSDYNKLNCHAKWNFTRKTMLHFFLFFFYNLLCWCYLHPFKLYVHVKFCLYKWSNEEACRVKANIELKKTLLNNIVFIICWHANVFLCEWVQGNISITHSPKNWKINLHTNTKSFNVNYNQMK